MALATATTAQDLDRTNLGWLFCLLRSNAASMDVALSQRLRTPPPMPTRRSTAETMLSSPGNAVSGMSQVESTPSILNQVPLPGPERMPPVPRDLPPPLEIPPQSPPEIREPDLPGEHSPISDGPHLSAACHPPQPTDHP